MRVTLTDLRLGQFAAVDTPPVAQYPIRMELNATILLQAAIFFALLAWLSPVLFDPMLKLFEEREKRIVGASEEAKRLSGSADDAAKRLEEKTKEAQTEARKVLASLRASALEKEAQIVGAAKQAATTKLDEARSDLFEATEEARRSLKDDAKNLSSQIVEKVLGRAA
jgi:F-type H+-transporting ATPase subunit b